MKNKVYYYIVEGEVEEKVINTIKNNLIEAGKVLVRNPIQHKISTTFLRTMKPNTIIILVFDTDVETNLEILKKNIEEFKKFKNIKETILIPQVLKCSNLLSRLEEKKFNIKKFWSTQSNNSFREFNNRGNEIKK